MLERVWRKGTPLHCWWECKLIQSLWTTVWIFLKKLKMELPYDPAIPLLCIYPKKVKTLIRKDICISVLIAALSTIAKIRKQLMFPSIDEWLKNMWYIHTMEYYSAIKKEWNLVICDNMDGLENIMPSEISQTEKDKYYMISLIYRI